MSMVSRQPENTRGQTISTAFGNFMPMFYAYINNIVNRGQAGPHGLNENQVKVIMAVNYLGETSPAQLSRAFHMFKGSLTTIVRSLVSMGMLAVRDDPRDARRYYLRTTETAQAWILEKAVLDAQSLDALFANMPDPDFQRVCDGLSLLSGYLREKDQANR